MDYYSYFCQKVVVCGCSELFVFNTDTQAVISGEYGNRDFVFFVFERTKHQPRRHLRSHLVLQRLCNEAALSPGNNAFWYLILV